MCMKLSLENLDSNPSFPHSTNTYICEMTMDHDTFQNN